MSALTQKEKLKKLKSFHIIAIILIVATAFLLRIWNIENIPAGIYPDEAVNGTDALKANETGEYRWFYTNNYGREGLFINLIAVALKVFGPTVLALKFWSIIFGTLTVLGVFLLTRELFRNPLLALIAAYFTAFSFWAINFSRIAFRAIMMLPILVFSFYFVFRGLRTRKYSDFALAGFIFGLGFHTYIAFRIAPLILLVGLFFLILNQRKFIAKFWKHLLIFGVFVLISAGPLFLNFYQHPEYFQSRTGAISVFSPEVNQGHLAATLAKTIGASLVKYNFWGDQNWRHNYPPYPVLHPLVGIAFLAGLIYITLRFFYFFYRRVFQKIRNEKLTVYGFLLAWFTAMLVPEFLTKEGLPHALRSIGTLPIVYIIAAIPIFWLIKKSKEFGSGFKVSVISFLAIAALLIATTNISKYFYFWANEPEQHGAFNENFKNMGIYLNSFPADSNKYVITNGGGRIMEDGLPVSAQTIKFLTYGKVQNLEFLSEDKIGSIAVPAEIILMNYDENIIKEIQNIYSETQIRKIIFFPKFGSDFISISIKSATKVQPSLRE